MPVNKCNYSLLHANSHFTLLLAVSPQSIEHKWVLVQVLSPIPSVGLSVGLSVGCLSSVLRKIAHWIWMPFGVVGQLGPRIRQVDSGDHPMGRGNFGVNEGHPIVTNGNFVAWLCKSA